MYTFDNSAIKQVISDMIACKHIIKVSVDCETELKNLIGFVQNQYPILFHFNTIRYFYNPKTHSAELNPFYLFTHKEYKDLINEIIIKLNQFKKEVDIDKCSSSFVKEKVIHDYCCQHIEYIDEGELSHTIVGPLLSNKGVCDGISKAAKLLFQISGIKSLILKGAAKPSRLEPFQPHTWNRIFIDNYWYNLDITFDITLSNGCVRYDYFNVCDELMPDHVIEDDVTIQRPVCNCNRDYYSVTGTSFLTVSEAETYILNCLRQQLSVIQIRMIIPYDEEFVQRFFEKCLCKTHMRCNYIMSYNESRGVFCWILEKPFNSHCVTNAT